MNPQKTSNTTDHNICVALVHSVDCVPTSIHTLAFWCDNVRYYTNSHLAFCWTACASQRVLGLALPRTPDIFEETPRDPSDELLRVYQSLAARSTNLSATLEETSRAAENSLWRKVPKGRRVQTCQDKRARTRYPRFRYTNSRTRN